MRLLATSGEIVRLLPRWELYTIGSQMRRAALSVPSNIAEGHGDDYHANFLKHLSHAKASLRELETHLLATEVLGYATREQLAPSLHLSDEIGRMLRSMTKRLREKEK